ncbi:MAG: hypothetical protein COX81_01135 [Candidatus Magasanikbacteria bacterium CG_4_10_14_0_2_um_filter_37_12]|uniref:Glycosyltransferase 2-like domain-containing protein n=1 Tax=Candidatus Magasanikbacteria bacterium CG_4_10_14_0_2_um_filter_37_12 TaxID=1974637 RepID=A0A2M7V912_9BACT|nr:MAG: hypothetical protein COX81_01135 [Candidatus Magasanikbacteria bacterium CG_4_10_14_0_2_um_filter_37_12]
MDQLVSIIIPVYNQSQKLLRAVLDSIEKQIYDNLEVVVVDDGSEPAFNFQTSDFRFPIEVLRQENMGAPVARNKGFELSKGEYVIFWDADIVGNPEMIEKMYSALEKNKEASYSYCNFQFSIFNFQNKKMSSRLFDESELKKNNFIHTTSLIRKDVFPRFDENLRRFQDWDLWLTMLEQGKKGVWIDEYLFSIVKSGRISSWLPRIAYQKPLRWLPGVAGKVRKYEEGREVVLRKHDL